jgi:GxxExxY protein
MTPGSRDEPKRELPNLKYARVTDIIIGVFYQVYGELGYGFLESVYRNALSIGFNAAGLSVQREVPLTVYFQRKVVGKFRADFLVEFVVLVEVKTVSAITDAHQAQLLNYLKCTDVEVGLILNFGERSSFKRLVFDRSRKLR